MANAVKCVCLILLSMNFICKIDGSISMDIVLLVDSSDNVRSQRFEKEMRFLFDFVNQVFDQDVQISLFTFGKDAYSAFTLDAYNTKQDLSQAVRYVWFSTGNGNVSNALNTTLAKAFTQQSGGRECVTKFIIVVSHSALKDNAEAMYYRNKLERMRVRTFVLNVAGGTAEADFVTMADNSNRVVTVNNFQELESTVSTLIAKIKTDLPNTGCGMLSAWSDWTPCSVTCGQGLRFQTRYCVKVNDSDEDCEGVSTKNKLCNLPNCTDPLDGAWSMWQDWGGCSKTCEKGSKQRTRWCNNPAPENGGKPCVGKSTESKDCADWKCPDCQTSCPPGSHLSQSCDVCECSSVTLFGKLMDNTNETVKNAEIFLQSRRYKPIATSNRLGVFRASGLCMRNENVFIQAKCCEGRMFTTKEINSTHWTLNSLRLDRYVPPVFTTQPDDKVRMVGQSVSFCCIAVGYPSPKSYKWFKDDIELDGIGQNGTLIMQSLKKSDDGKYWCYTETDAGVTLSEKVDLKVFDNGEDTCGSPISKFQTLPGGCFQTGDTTKNNTIDVGDCGKARCVKSSLHDNGSCSDWWSHHCCNPKDTESVDITCDGFTYKTTKVKSCECKLCVFKTMIFGRAIGRKNGTDIPFKLGEVIVNGKPIAKANAAGLFKFEVPSNVRRVVATFFDNYDDIFETTTKIIQVNPGGEVFASIVLPLKPKPIAFEADNGTEVHLGASDNTNAVASLEIPPNSIVTIDGEPYSGPVKATFSYMDPRNRDDLEAANGEFESEAPNGEKIPLVTYGMFQINMKDKDGNPLKVNQPIKYAQDASLFNVPFDKDGNPDLNLWSYDRNKGVWVDIAKVRIEQPASEGRKLLATRLVAEIDDKNIPEIELVKETTSYEFTGRYTNCDHSVRIYDYVTKRDVKEGACYISVSVYKSMDLSEPYEGTDVEIKAFIKDEDDDKLPFTFFSTIRMLTNGHACVPVFCNKYIQLHVRRNKERFYAAKHYLPNPYYVKRTVDNEIHFESTMFGDALNCSALPYLKPNSTCDGPMFPKLDMGLGMCSRMKYNDNSFQFKFAPFARPPEKHEVAGEGNYDSKLSWYPVLPEKATFRSCFMKVRIDIQATYDLRVIAISRLHNISGEDFGSYSVGPVPDPETDNKTARCACVEFRCPWYVKDGNKEMFNLNTFIEVQLTSMNTSMKCKISNVNSRITVNPVQNTKNGTVGFRFTAEAGNNYGRNFGVYIYDYSKKEVQQVCENGIEAGPKANGGVHPTLNTAVEFDCL